MTFFLARTVRRAVSQDRRRFNDGIYDLDLSYITERIIAMAIPGSGIEVLFCLLFLPFFLFRHYLSSFNRFSPLFPSL